MMDSIALTRIEELARKKAVRDSGKFNLIPFYKHLPRFSEYVPGLMPGVMYKILSQSGIGKTKLAKFLTVLIPYYYYKQHGEKFHTVYVALEESKEEFIDSLIVMFLSIKYNIRTTTLQINSYAKHKLSDDLLKKMKDCSEIVDDILQHVTIIDSVYNPTGIYKQCQEISRAKGTHHNKTIIINGKPTEVYSHYTPNDPDERVILVADHLSLLATESGKTLHQVMGLWSADYCRKQISKHWNWIVVNVQQLAAEGENVEHFKANKLEPSLDKAANNKEIIRDDFVVIALFAPVRYELKKCLGYDVTKLKDHFRQLQVLKNRIGQPGVKVGMLFDGATNKFEELPLPNSLSMPAIYQDVENGKI